MIVFQENEGNEIVRIYIEINVYYCLLSGCLKLGRRGRLFCLTQSATEGYIQDYSSYNSTKHLNTHTKSKTLFFNNHKTYYYN